MEKLVDSDTEEEDVSQQPMQAYNMSAINNIQLPSLEFDNDSDFGADDELELICHPVLDQGIISTGATLDTNSPCDEDICVEDICREDGDLQCPITTAGDLQEASKAEHESTQHEVKFTKLTDAHLAEMELDNAILSLVPSHSLHVSVNQDSSGLSDSSSSGSSILGKLEETMAMLMKENERENGEIHDNVDNLRSKGKSEQNEEPKTIKLDLRHAQKTIHIDDAGLQPHIPMNRCVLQRYGRTHFSTIDEDQENEDVRRRLKEESKLITLNKGKRASAAPSLMSAPASTKDRECNNESTECSNVEKGWNERIIRHENGDRSPPADGKPVLSHSVDSMLENINRIMCRGTDDSKAVNRKPLEDEAIKKYVLKTQHCDSGREEYVEVINDEKPVKGITISPNPCFSSKAHAVEMSSTGNAMLPGSNHSVNQEMHTQLVGWSDILQTTEQRDLKTTSHVKNDINEEISDSIFKNSFFKKIEKVEHNEENLINNLKPRKDILGTGRRKKNQPVKIDKTKSSSCTGSVNNQNIQALPVEDSCIKNNEKTSSPSKSLERTQLLNDENEEVITTYVGDTPFGGEYYYNGVSEKEILESTKEFKMGIRNSYCHENGEIQETKICADKMYRQLKFPDEKTIDNVVNNNILDEQTYCDKCGQGRKTRMANGECLLCQIKNSYVKTPTNCDVSKRECLLSQINNSPVEAPMKSEEHTPMKHEHTPVKHEEQTCMNNNHMIDTNTSKKIINRAIKKTSRTKDVSTNILNLRDVNKTKQEKEKENVVEPVVKNHLEESHNLNEDNKENSVEEPNSKISVSPVDVNSTQPMVTAKNSKNRKKKKSKNKVVSEKRTADVGVGTEEPVVNHVSSLPKKVAEEMDILWKEITPGRREMLLYDEEMSFKQGYVTKPDTSKQLLLLKIPLQSPGVCKANQMDSIYAFADQTNSDNYIGLVTLFIYLLQGSRRDLSTQHLDVPFDVVLLQQAHLDSELLLIVGIAENKNTYQQKTKRTKLGTNFFHAVSQFLNTNYLDKILSKIWEHTESADVSRLQNSYPFNHIWRQVELKSSERCSIPGSGKLSTFINISPDTNALHRICSLSPALIVHNKTKQGNVIPEEYNWFDPVGVQQEYTCITVEDATAISPKHLSELLKRLRRESVEICGLRIGYSIKDDSLSMPALSICINEFKSATANEGKLLLSHCEELKELAISFSTQENISVIMNGSPLLKYTINPQRSHRQVVQWFGPHYRDVDELKNVIAELKSTSKVSSNKNDKKKWALGSCQCEISLLNTYTSSAVLFISALVPSAFIAFVISIALKKGLQLKMVYKTSCSMSQLGLAEDKGDVPGHSEIDKRKGTVPKSMVSCMLLLFSGKSAALRLLGLMYKFTEILNNPLTGETLAPWMADNMIKFKPSHNNTNNNNSCKLSNVPRDYFAVLHFNDHIKDLLSTSYKPPKQHIVEDIYSILSKVQINLCKPEVNLMALLLYGDDILKEVPTILRIIFRDCAYECLNLWRQSVRCQPFAVRYQPPIEFLGAKYINSISKVQASNVVLHEPFTPLWQSKLSELQGSNGVLFVLKTADKRNVSKINETVSNYILSCKLDPTSNFIASTDTEHVFRLMFHFFEPNELHGDQLRDQSQIPPMCLPDNHVLFTTLDNVIDTHLHTQTLIKQKLPDKDWANILPYRDLPTTNHVYQFTPSSISFPLQMLLCSEKSYAGISFEYLPHNIQTISKALARVVRMGFQLAALKFPSYDANGLCHVRAVLLRQDAVFVLNKMVAELETNYSKLKFTITDNVHGVTAYVLNEFKHNSDCGGIFHCNYFALLNEINFKEDDCFESRKYREVEWNPQNCNFENGLWHVKKENTPLSITGSLMATTDEVSVVILTEALLSGRYLGKKLPENCVFPEVLHVFESALYRVIAGKTTMLTTKGAEELVDIYKVDERRKSSFVRLLSQAGGPFVVVVLVGSCILSNFWLSMERKLDEDTLNALKHHALVPTRKKQVESLLRSLVDRVVPNTKVELKTRLV